MIWVIQFLKRFLMRQFMGKRNSLHLVFIAILAFGISGCDKSQKLSYHFIDEGKLSSGESFFIYKKSTFSGEPSNCYFAVGESYCTVYKDSSKTFAQTLSLAQIETVRNDTVFVASVHPIEYKSHEKSVFIVVRKMLPTDPVKLSIDTLIDRHCYE
ncbi:MAG: hypothetical protein KA821_02795 [Chitinophagaceae bacterium]|nr:hypothetical protein [Chitinophagaceae bacterium]